VKGEFGFFITLFAVKKVNQGEKAKICYHACTRESDPSSTLFASTVKKKRILILYHSLGNGFISWDNSKPKYITMKEKAFKFKRKA